MISDFSEEQKRILSRYFTSVDSPVFGLINLPEVIKGTLFSRYSRTSKDLRTLFLEEFYLHDSLSGVFDSDSSSAGLNVSKAEDFYDRVLVGYGDDSVAELGGAHIAIEDISMLATKSIEEHRIGLSPLEKSTRYVYYDKKVRGSYLYYLDRHIMDSEFADLYVKTNDMLFDTYSKIVREIQPFLQKIFPGDSTEAAYKSSIRAKACDIARSLLPLSAKTNMGVMGNGRAFEYLLTTLFRDPLLEVRDVAHNLYNTLHALIPSFVKRAVGERGERYRQYLDNTERPLLSLRDNFEAPKLSLSQPRIRLVDFDPLAVEKILAALLYQYTDLDYLNAYQESCRLSFDEKVALIKQLGMYRENRHHKPLRFTEEPYFAFEIIADWGVYKDLMRHRILTRYKKSFSSEMGYYIPEEIILAGFESAYRQAMDFARDAFMTVRVRFPYEAQYLVTHGSYTSFYLRMNLREFVHFVELRSIAQGHPSYRSVAQEMARLVTEQFPIFSYLYRFVDYSDYDLERLEAFRKIEKKALSLGVSAFEE